MGKTNQKLNSTLSIKKVEKNGKTFNNLLLTVLLNNGEVVTFEIKEKFFNHKFNFKLVQNLSEVE